MIVIVPMTGLVDTLWVWSSHSQARLLYAFSLFSRWQTRLCGQGGILLPRLST